MRRGKPLFLPLVAWACICSAEVTHFLPTSEVIAILAALPSKEGYRVGKHGVYLDEMRDPQGHEPYAGYTSFGLYVGGHLARFYAVRINTGDIVDPVNCKIYRSPNAIAFRDETTKSFGTKAVTIIYLANEVGCDRLRVVVK